LADTPKIIIKSEDKRLAYGEVYAPLRVDTDGEAMNAEAIEKAAHEFLASGRIDQIDVQHSFEKSGCVVVESFIARKNDPDGFIEGSWVLGVRILPDELWLAVKSGEINGFSFAGLPGGRTPAKVTVDMAKRVVGETEKSTDGPFPEHSHDLELEFNEAGRPIMTKTGEAIGHVHVVRKLTATDREFDHAHRLILIENE
jgi:hypothetical protein